MFIAGKGTHEGEPCVYIDLYRVKDEKIVEHWGFPEMVPPKEQWKNNNGIPACCVRWLEVGQNTV